MPHPHLITFLSAHVGGGFSLSVHISTVLECIFNIMKTFIMQALYVCIIIKQGPSSRGPMG